MRDFLLWSAWCSVFAIFLGSLVLLFLLLDREKNRDAEMQKILEARRIRCAERIRLSTERHAARLKACGNHARYIERRNYEV